jgi:single-strand DNA-binding protein
MNTISINGRLVRDVEAQTVGEHTVYKGTIVHDTGFGDKKTPMFLDFEVWNKTGAAMANYCGKGSHVALAGELKLNQWEDSNGNKRSKHFIGVARVDFISTEKVEKKEPEDVPF